MHRRVENTEVETGRTNQRGVYSGATQSFVKGMADVPYWGSARAVTDCEFWVIGAAEFGEKFREWFPMAMHLLEGLTMGFRSSQADHRAAGAAAVAGPAVGRADPRAEQPCRRRRTRHSDPAGTGQQDAGASSRTWRRQTSTPRLWWLLPISRRPR